MNRLQASEKRYSNLLGFWKAEKKKNKLLLDALEVAKPFMFCICDNEYQCQGCGIAEAIEQVEQAIVIVKGEENE